MLLLATWAKAMHLAIELAIDLIANITKFWLLNIVNC